MLYGPRNRNESLKNFHRNELSAILERSIQCSQYMHELDKQAAWFACAAVITLPLFNQ